MKYVILKSVMAVMILTAGCGAAGADCPKFRRGTRSG